MMKSISLLTVLILWAPLLAGPTTRPVADGAGLLILSADGIPDAGIAAMMLETHAVMLQNPALIRNVVEQHPKFRETAFFKAIQARGGNAVDEYLRVLDVRTIPGTLLIRVNVDREVVGADSRELIQCLCDSHITNLQRMRFDKTNRELEVAKQWRDRYNRELSRLIERIKQMHALSAAAGDERAAREQADELASLKEERSRYRQLQSQADDRVAYLQNQVRQDEVELRWAFLPTQ